MKKIIIILVFILIIILLGSLGYKAINRYQKRTSITNKIQTLPKLSFVTLNNKVFNNKNIKPNLPILINYFHPECEHCQYEVKDIISHTSDFTQIQLLMISPAKVTEIKRFKKAYNLDQLNNLILLHDTSGQVQNLWIPINT